LKFLPLFLKKFEDFCKNLQFFEGFYTLRISPGLLVHVNPALFLVTPAKECHPWTLSPFPIRHPSFFIVTPASFFVIPAKAGIYPLALEAAIKYLLFITCKPPRRKPGSSHLEGN
jgi:hypothetical protein